MDALFTLSYGTRGKVSTSDQFLASSLQSFNDILMAVQFCLKVLLYDERVWLIILQCQSIRPCIRQKTAKYSYCIMKQSFYCLFNYSVRNPCCLSANYNSNNNNTYTFKVKIRMQNSLISSCLQMVYTII